MNSKYRLKDNMYITLIGCCYAQIIFESLGYSNITSVLFYFSFILLLACWLIGSFVINEKFNRLIILLFILCFFNVLFNALLSGDRLTFGAIKKVLFLISTLVAYKVALTELNITKIEKWYTFFVLIISCVFIILYLARNSQMHLFYNMVTEYLTFNLENPNKAALFLCVIAISNLTLSSRQNRLISKLVFVALTVVFVIFISLTKSRNALLAFCSFCLLYFYVILHDTKKISIHKSLNFVIAVLPLIFAILYLVFVNNALITKFFDFAISEGKRLDSREVMWINAFSVLKKHPIFGGFSQLRGQNEIFQMHNTHVDILSTFGVVPFVLFVSFLYKILNVLSNGNELNKYKMVYYFAFVETILLGMFEAGVYNGCNGLGILTSVFVAFSMNFEDRKNYRKRIRIKRID